MLWGKVAMILAALLGNITDVVGFLDLPTLQLYLEKYITDPKVVGLILISFMAVTMVARRRSL